MSPVVGEPLSVSFTLLPDATEVGSKSAEQVELPTVQFGSGASQAGSGAVAQNGIVTGTNVPELQFQVAVPVVGPIESVSVTVCPKLSSVGVVSDWQLASPRLQVLAGAAHLPAARLQVAEPTGLSAPLLQDQPMVPVVLPTVSLSVTWAPDSSVVGVVSDWQLAEPMVQDDDGALQGNCAGGALQVGVPMGVSTRSEHAYSELPTNAPALSLSLMVLPLAR